MTPKPEVRHYSRCQSSRNGARILLIVLHDTEGANLPGIRDLAGLGDYFDRAATQASSHAANDAEGNGARYVPDSRKAWHCAGFNSVSLGLEQIGFASQGFWPDAQIRNASEWVAYWSRLHGIPIQRGKVRGGVVEKPGVVLHSELGAVGGGHHDPGPAYPVDKVVALALQIGPVSAKQTTWQHHLADNRARLKSLLALRSRMRQNKLEGSSGYQKSSADLNALRQTIDRLKRLVRR